MSRYGAIYIAHATGVAETALYHVGSTTRAVRERLIELGEERDAANPLTEIGHIVVADVDAAARACRRKLQPLRVRKSGQLVSGDLQSIIATVTACCRPYAIAEILPDTSGLMPRHDLQRIFDDTVESKRRQEQLQSDRIGDARSAFQAAVVSLAEASEILRLKLASRTDGASLEIFPASAAAPASGESGESHVVCKITLRAPLDLPLLENGAACTPLKFRESVPPPGFDAATGLDDDGTYAVIELRVETSSALELRYSICGYTPSFDESGGGVFRRRMLAPMKSRARLTDIDEAKIAFVQFVAMNTCDPPKRVERGCYTNKRDQGQRYGSYSARSGSGGYTALTSYLKGSRSGYHHHCVWTNELDCALDTTVLAPYVPQDDLRPREN